MAPLFCSSLFNYNCIIYRLELRVHEAPWNCLDTNSNKNSELSAFRNGKAQEKLEGNFSRKEDDDDWVLPPTSEKVLTSNEMSI